MQTINPANLSISVEQWVALSPFLTMLLGSMVVLLAGTANTQQASTRRKWVFGLSVLTLVATGVIQATHWMQAPMPLFNGMMVLDYFSSFFNVLICSGTLLVLFGCYHYLDKEHIHYSEFYALLLLSSLGMMVLGASTELLTMFIAIEIMSLGVYVLVGIRRRDRISNEASVKYFVMGGVAAAFILYGTALIYGATATTKLSQLAQLFSQPEVVANPVLILGISLLFIGFLFKIAAVPFHMWTPDVYEGAPAVVTAYMATVLKAAVFAALIRISVVILGDAGVTRLGELSTTLHGVIWWIAFLTIALGNLVALKQKNLKRLLAYSAIAHTGYLMLGLLAGPKTGYSGILIYLVAYVAMNIGAFAILALFSEHNDRKLDTEDLAGIAYKNPLFAGAMVVFLLSLGGLPPTAGFVGKYFLFTSALEAGETLLVLLAVVMSVISVFYYMRIVVQMYMKEAVGGIRTAGVSYATVAAIVLCVFLTIHFGVMPESLLAMVRKAASF